MNSGENEITAPHNNAGLDDQISSSRRGSVFLDILFYITGFLETANRREATFLCYARYWPVARIFVAAVQFWTTLKYRATPSAPTSNGFGSPVWRFAAPWALKQSSSNSEGFDISA